MLSANASGTQALNVQGKREKRTEREAGSAKRSTVHLADSRALKERTKTYISQKKMVLIDAGTSD